MAASSLFRGRGNQTLKPSKSAILSRDFSGIGSDSMMVTLASGLPDSNLGDIRDVAVEPLTGWDEQWLDPGSGDWSLSGWVTRLLGAKVLHHGVPIETDKASRLSVVDRDLLILYLRMLTFGQEIWGVTQCSHESCGAKLDFTFDLSCLKVLPRPPRALESSMVSIGEKQVEFSFREPNGLDQSAIAGIMIGDPYKAWLTLLARCILKWEDADFVTTEILGDLPPETLLAIDGVMAAGTGSMDRDIEFTCTECRRSFSATIDIPSFFCQELQYSSENLWEEIHHLAFFYHWTETDILALPRWKRKMYLGFISRQVQGR
jgi:hypothetical protein